MKILINDKNEFIQTLSDSDRVVEIDEEVGSPPSVAVGEETYLVYEPKTNKLVWKKRLRSLTPEEEMMVLNQTVQELLLAQKSSALGGVPNGQVV